MASGEIGVNWLKFAQLEAKFGADPSQDFPVDSHWLNKNSCNYFGNDSKKVVLKHWEMSGVELILSLYYDYVASSHNTGCN